MSGKWIPIVLFTSVMAVSHVSYATAQRVGVVDGSSVNVSLGVIVATASEYQDQRIRTYGVLYVAPGGGTEGGSVALFLTKEQKDYFVASNAVFIELSDPAMFEGLSDMDGRYVIVEGRVDAAPQGHMGVYSAGLADVNRIELLGSEIAKSMNASQ